jgi:hypothetical protein
VHKCICGENNKKKCISTKLHICQCDNINKIACIAGYHKCTCENGTCKNRNKNCKCVCDKKKYTCIKC